MSKTHLQLATDAGRLCQDEGAKSAVGGLAGFILACLPRLRQVWNVDQKDRRQMKLIETLPLGGRRQLMLIVCDGERFLVGSSAESVQTIVRVHPESAKSTAVRPADKVLAEPWG